MDDRFRSFAAAKPSADAECFSQHGLSSARARPVLIVPAQTMLGGGANCRHFWGGGTVIPALVQLPNIGPDRSFGRPTSTPTGPVSPWR